jgi:hypothetical protein
VSSVYRESESSGVKVASKTRDSNCLAVFATRKYLINQLMLGFDALSIEI